MDTRDDVTAATTQALDAVHDITDRTLGPEIARAVLLGVAAIMIARNLGGDLNADAVNETWRKLGFGWRLSRLQ